MSSQHPFRILEISVISAQELPPVSKMLRTFVVAWLNSDQKLTTRIDHHGHTNPIWNYKLVFRVDDRFLTSESSFIFFEIYNVAWLRDLPVGTARLQISSLSPPITQKHHLLRPLALHVRRPSGHLQGILNLSIHLLDHNPPTIQSVLSASSTNSVMQSSEQLPIDREDHVDKDATKDDENNGGAQMPPSKSGRMSINDQAISIASNGDEKKDSRSNMSWCSIMHPLPSEVVSNLNKGLYFGGGQEQLGSSIFENWTTEASSESHEGRLMLERSSYLVDDSSHEKMSWKMDHHDDPGWRKWKRRHHSGRGSGLLSCFGSAYGFQFKCFFGSKSKSEKKKEKKRQKVDHEKQLFACHYCEENLRKIYL